MKWSLKLGEVAGIGIYVHWTFSILLVWIAAAYLMAGQGWAGAADGIAFILAIFACVVLHELGHALTARQYNVRTRDITLLPIGGVARLERIPRDPTHEFWIAVAGPAVNVAIGALLFVAVLVLDQVNQVYSVGIVAGPFLAKLMWVNVALVLFNMLPAFPMDGGRVLRSLLARRFSYVQATQVAATVGQAMAVLFGVAGFFLNPLLLFIALFVYIGAQGEAHMAQLRDMFQGIPVRDAMITRFRTVSSGDTLNHVVDELLSGWQNDFPVVDDGRLTGMLLRTDIIRAITNGGSSALVRDYMHCNCHTVSDTEMLEGSLMQMQLGECSTLPVVHDGRLIGLFTSDNVSEWVAVHNALDGRGKPVNGRRAGAYSSSSSPKSCCST